ncbi:ATP-dependent 3'-5' DNA helicase [Saccharomycopsis crataegensis]|uniref:DNA 3'-5' helicase n=1 Tax=Saccharomycopsis crataegensis TaxID=43959 RepID=A0AAV5QQE7_9ASCO|nr:ATP-dependent 3'-5' DNA helicase [Saccharomycopsis crataegensis]
MSEPLTNGSATDLQFSATPLQWKAIEFPPASNTITAILAGPGCGKTRTLILRCLHMMSIGIQPHEILVLSMTNSAARHLKSELRKVLSRETLQQTDTEVVGAVESLPPSEIEYIISNMNILTFDSFAGQIIAADRGSPMKILDPSYYDDIMYLTSSSRQTGRNHTASVRSRIDKWPLDARDHVIETALNKLRDTEGLATFAWIRYRTLQLLSTKFSSVVGVGRYRVLMIDEFQDLYGDLLRMVELVAVEDRGLHLTVVGDADQSIYGFLGSIDTDKKLKQVEQKSGRQLQQIVLNESFRSTGEIIKFSNQLTSTKLVNYHQDGNDDLPVSHESFSSALERADFVAREIKRLLRQSIITSLSNVLVLTRTNRPTSLMESFNFYGIKFHKRQSSVPGWMSGSISLIHYLQVLANPQEFEFSMICVMMSISGMSRPSMDVVQRKFEAWQKTKPGKAASTLWEYLIDPSTKHSSKKVIRFIETTNHWRDRIQGGGKDGAKLNNPQDLFNALLQYIADLDSARRIISTNLLVSGTARDELEKFYLGLKDASVVREAKLQEMSQNQSNEMNNVLGEEASVMRDEPEVPDLIDWFVEGYNERLYKDSSQRLGKEGVPDDAVQVSTIHAAKGLQSPVVFVLADTTYASLASKQKHELSLQEPSSPRSMYQRGSKIKRHWDEEEVRVHYVATTRAQKKLYFCELHDQFVRIGGSSQYIENPLEMKNRSTPGFPNKIASGDQLQNARKRMYSSWHRPMGRYNFGGSMRFVGRVLRVVLK